MRTIEELRAYFLNLLKNALSHSSMYGGEEFIGLYLSHISFIDKSEEALAREMKYLRDSGASSPRGVAGAFFRRIGIFDSGSRKWHLFTQKSLSEWDI